MAADTDPDRNRAQLAQAMKQMREDWALQVELVKLQASLARERYVALKAAGFNDAQALELCTQPIQL